MENTTKPTEIAQDEEQWIQVPIPRHLVAALDARAKDNQRSRTREAAYIICKAITTNEQGGTA